MTICQTPFLLFTQGFKKRYFNYGVGINCIQYKSNHKADPNFAKICVVSDYFATFSYFGNTPCYLIQKERYEGSEVIHTLT